MQPLKVGEITEGVAVIQSGVEEGQPVVTAGQYRLQPGAKVEVRTAVAQRPSATEAPAADSVGRGP